MNKQSNKTDFLHNCHIQLSIHTDCLKEIDRIAELVTRTNQLNYTKIRSTKEELISLINNPEFQCSYAKVSDCYGDYGIVGFYCLDTVKDTLLHYLFSCRIIGIGIEQYLYIKLGCPAIKIVPPVAVTLDNNTTVNWIHEETIGASSYSSDSNTLFHNHRKPRILLKGPCDMSAISSYLIGGDVTYEFNYVNQQGFITAGQNHSQHIKESLLYSREEINQLLEQVPFVDYGDFYTNLFLEPYDIVCYSLLPDCHTGVYQNKENSFTISFGSKNFDLTNQTFWNGYIAGTLPNHGFSFTKNILSDFQKQWDYKGCLSASQIIENLQYIYENLPGNPLFILLLGSELEYLGENEEFKDHAAFHKEVNLAIKKTFANKKHIKIVDTTSFIHSQNDYMDCINHYSRNVYYDLATEIVKYINDFFS